VATQARDGLGEVYGLEGNKEAERRILAAHCVKDMDITLEVAAGEAFASAPSVSNWMARHEEGGVGALRDLPRPGRPRLVGRDDMGSILDGVSRPHTRLAEARRDIHECTCVWYEFTVWLRKRERGLSRKRPHPVHANRARDPTVSRWQWSTRRRIRGLERRGHTVVAQDEVILPHGAAGGRGSSPGAASAPPSRTPGAAGSSPCTGGSPATGGAYATWAKSLAPAR